MIRAFRQNPKDSIAGVVFFGIGAGAYVLSHDYDIGTATNMGPGYFPAMLSIALMVVGVASFARSLRGQSEPITFVHILPLVQIVAGVIAFSVLIERTGLVASVFALIAFVCANRVLTRPVEVLVTFVVLAWASVMLFVRVLNLPITAF